MPALRSVLALVLAPYRLTDLGGRPNGEARARARARSSAEETHPAVGVWDLEFLPPAVTVRPPGHCDGLQRHTQPAAHRLRDEGRSGHPRTRAPEEMGSREA